MRYPNAPQKYDNPEMQAEFERRWNNQARIIVPAVRTTIRIAKVAVIAGVGYWAYKKVTQEITEVDETLES